MTETGHRPATRVPPPLTPEEERVVGLAAAAYALTQPDPAGALEELVDALGLNHRPIRVRMKQWGGPKPLPRRPARSVVLTDAGEAAVRSEL